MQCVVSLIVPPFPRSEAAKMKDTTQIDHRMIVRKRMNCNNFKWFLDNIWPEHFFPADDRFFGKVRLLHDCYVNVYYVWLAVSVARLRACHGPATNSPSPGGNGRYLVSHFKLAFG